MPAASSPSPDKSMLYCRALHILNGMAEQMGVPLLISAAHANTKKFSVSLQLPGMKEPFIKVAADSITDEDFETLCLFQEKCSEALKKYEVFIDQLAKSADAGIRDVILTLRDKATRTQWFRDFVTETAKSVRKQKKKSGTK
jgi:hypothetical protein